jgi:redox-sensitive bicupin YhaK (pirin superfamily)
MGNEGVIRFGEVQVMSAGTGIQHSEMNVSQNDSAKTLQLWILPDKEDVTPRYDQKSFDIENQINKFVTIVSPKDKNDGTALWVYQQTFLSLGIFEKGTAITYKVNIPENGVYLFLLVISNSCNNTYCAINPTIAVIPDYY